MMASKTIKEVNVCIDAIMIASRTLKEVNVCIDAIMIASRTLKEVSVITAGRQQSCGESYYTV